MVRGELLRRLFRSYSERDDHRFRTVALEIIAEEQQKHNNALAKELMQIIDSNVEELQPSWKPALAGSEEVRDSGKSLVDVRQPHRAMADIVLREQTREQLYRIVEEYHKAESLRVHGLKPKSKILFCGPPGCGKTLCAEIISSELGLPIMYTRFDAIVSSYLGETATNLRSVFQHATEGKWLLMFDEFDAIGKTRDDESEHGELKKSCKQFSSVAGHI